jgi:hypothetical protein
MSAYDDFYTVQKELVDAGRTFGADDLKRLRYGDLFLAGIGNAGKAICRQHGLIEAEQNRRLDALTNGIPTDEFPQLAFEDDHMLYAAYRRRAPASVRWDEAPIGVRLYWVCACIRGHWGGAQERIDLVIKLCNEALQRETLPAGWAARCRYLATDVFDGHFADGRVFRDGSMHLPPEMAEQMGIPADQVVSGNMAKMIGARKDNPEDRWDGSYEQLYAEILTPTEKTQALTRQVVDLPYDDDCGCYEGDDE